MHYARLRVSLTKNQMVESKLCGSKKKTVLLRSAQEIYWPGQESLVMWTPGVTGAGVARLERRPGRGEHLRGSLHIRQARHGSWKRDFLFIQSIWMFTVRERSGMELESFAYRALLSVSSRSFLLFQRNEKDALLDLQQVVEEITRNRGGGAFRNRVSLLPPNRNGLRPQEPKFPGRIFHYKYLTGDPRLARKRIRKTCNYIKCDYAPPRCR